MTKGKRIFEKEQPASPEWIHAAEQSRRNILKKYGKNITK